MRSAAATPIVRPPGDELNHAAGDIYVGGYLGAIARRLRARGELPDLPRHRHCAAPDPDDVPGDAAALRAHVEAEIAAIRAESMAVVLAAARHETPTRRMTREHARREQNIGLRRAMRCPCDSPATGPARS